MARINGDIIFIDTSGQVRAVSSDLTLRANESGGGHIIVGSGISLRPEVNCDALDAIDLGQEIHRWKTLYACSGNFLDRPTVNGSGVLLQGEAGGAAAGVDSIEGLTGVVDLDSPDESININVNAQAIELTAPSGYAPSGASFILVDYNDNDHLTDARKLSATSGVILDDQGARSASGMVVKLDFDTEPASGNLLGWDGFKLQWTQVGPTPAIQILATTSFSPPVGTFGSMDFDATLIETDPSILEHNFIAKARIDIFASGLYEIGYHGRMETLGTVQLSSRVLLNGLTVVSGSETHQFIEVPALDPTLIHTMTCIAELNPGDFITTQFSQTLAGSVNVGSGAIFYVTKLDGITGSRGEKGEPGGVDSIEGLLGVVGLDSPDESVNINVNAQTIELTTPSGYAPSGVSYILVDYNDNEHLTDARKLTISSGILLRDDGAKSANGIIVSLDAENEPTVADQLVWNGSKTQWADTIESKSITVEDPTATEDIALFHADASYTITQMTVVLVGSASQTVTWTVRKNSDRSATGTEVVTGGTVTTNITTGDDVTTFNSDTIAADDFVWLETTAQGGTVTEFHLTIHMVKTSL